MELGGLKNDDECLHWEPIFNVGKELGIWYIPLFMEETQFLAELNT